MLVCLRRESKVEIQGQPHKTAIAKVTHRQTNQIFPPYILGIGGQMANLGRRDCFLTD